MVMGRWRIPNYISSTKKYHVVFVESVELVVQWNSVFSWLKTRALEYVNWPSRVGAWISLVVVVASFGVLLFFLDNIYFYSSFIDCKLL